MKLCHFLFLTLLFSLFSWSGLCAQTSYLFRGELKSFTEENGKTHEDVGEYAITLTIEKSSVSILLSEDVGTLGRKFIFDAASTKIVGEGETKIENNKGDSFSHVIHSSDMSMFAYFLLDKVIANRDEFHLQTGNLKFIIDLGEQGNVEFSKLGSDGTYRLIPYSGRGHYKLFNKVMEEVFAVFKKTSGGVNALQRVNPYANAGIDFGCTLPVGAVNLPAAQFLEKILGVFDPAVLCGDLAKQIKKKGWKYSVNKEFTCVYKTSSQEGYNLAYRGKLLDFMSVTYNSEGKDSSLLGWTYETSFIGETGTDSKMRAASFVRTFVEELNKNGYHLVETHEKEFVTLAFEQKNAGGWKIDVFSFQNRVNIIVWFQ